MHDAVSIIGGAGRQIEIGFRTGLPATWRPRARTPSVSRRWATRSATHHRRKPGRPLPAPATTWLPRPAGLRWCSRWGRDADSCRGPCSLAVLGCGSAGGVTSYHPGGSQPVASCWRRIGEPAAGKLAAVSTIRSAPMTRGSRQHACAGRARVAGRRNLLRGD